MSLTIMVVLTIPFPLSSLSQQADAAESHRTSDYYSALLSRADASLQKNPANIKMQLGRAIALRGLGRTKESLEQFATVLRAQPRNETALEGASEAAYTLGDNKAATYVDDLLRIRPDDPTANAIAGSLDYEKGNCDGAVKSFEKARAVIGANIPATLQYGGCLLLNGRATDAADVLKTMVNSGVNDKQLTFDLAYALYVEGKFDDSLSVLQRTNEEERSAEEWSLIANNDAKLNRVQPALDAYRSACLSEPKSEGYYIDLARFAMEHSSTEAAVKVLDAGIAEIPTSASLLTVRGSIYSYLGNTEAAESDFQRADAVEPKSGNGLIGKSLMLRDQGRSVDAKAMLRREIERHPKNIDAQYFLADMLIGSPSKADAIEARRLLTDVRRSRPNDANVLFDIARTYLNEGNRKSALPFLVRAIELDPKSPAILNRLLQVYRAEGMRAETAATASALRRVIDQEREQEVMQNRYQITATTR